jgi:DNA-binding IclR family transcriptional regulator
MGRDGLSVIEKTALIIERFLDERATSLTFNEILQGTPLSKTTTHRLLADMTERDLLTQGSPGDEYRLGPLLLSIGALAHRDINVPERALANMQLLRDQFGETIVLAELSGAAVVPIRRLDGLHEMRMNQEVGRGYPAYAGATGKALLASLDHDEQTKYLANVRLEPLTDATISRVEDLRLALDRIRRAGVAVSRGERVPDAVALSAAVLDGHSRPVCALTISGVASRWDRDRMFIGARAVKDAAETVSREVGYHPPPGGPTAAQLRDPESDAYQVLDQMCDEVWSSDLVRTADGGL